MNDSPYDSEPESVGEATLAALLWQKYHSELLLFISHRLDAKVARRIAAEDILAEVFLHVRKHWPPPAGMPEKLWLMQVARDRVIDAWRHSNRGKRDINRELHFPEESSAALALGLAADGTPPSQGAARSELSDRITLALNKLRDKDREVLVLRHLDGLTPAECAAVLNIRTNAYHQRYLNARKKMRALLDQLGGFDL